MRSGRAPARGGRTIRCDWSGSESNRRTADPKARRVTRVRDQHSRLAIDDLVLNAAEAGCDNRPLLPHRFGDREAEALGEVLLDDHIRVALQGVDDGGVLLDVGDRQCDEVDTPAHIRLETSPRIDHRSVRSRPLGIVGDCVSRRPGDHQMRLHLGGDVLCKAQQDANRILQSISARDLGDEPVIGIERGLPHTPPRGSCRRDRGCRRNA